MKKLLLIALFLISCNIISAQKPVLKQNEASNTLKGDPINQYNLDNISMLDVIKALNMLNISISKFEIPRTDKERRLGIIQDHYSKSKLVNSDTTWIGNNTYVYWERGDTTIYKDFIEGISLISKHEKKDYEVTVSIQTNTMTMSKVIKYTPEKKESFYNIRNFKQGELKYGEKMPMLAIASSWHDPKYNINRFCGVVKLSMEEKDTHELLNNSPDYYIISYIIK